MTEIEQLEQAIAALEAQRGLLGDDVVEITLEPMRARLAMLRAQQHPRSTQQRRQITILVADISGFTTLSEQMDAEDVSTLVNNLWKVLDQLLLQHGAYIYRHVGDSVIALWGVETAHEDDAEQAVSAALKLQESQSERIKLRVGLHTGMVLIHTLNNEVQVTGEAMNLADQVQRAAPIGGILITHDTYRLVRGLFDLLPAGTLSFPERGKTIPTYRILAHRPHAFHLPSPTIAGIEPPTLGRDAEIAQLQNAWLNLYAQSSLHAIIITAESGLGKSRLIFDLQTWLDLRSEPAVILQARASSQTAHTPYALFYQAIAAFCQVQEGDSSATAAQKLQDTLSPLFDEQSPEKVAIIGQLLGFDFSNNPLLSSSLNAPRQIRDRAYYYLTQLLQLTAQQSKVLLLFEDLESADDESLDLIDTLIQTSQNLPVLFILTCNPRLFERRPNWGSNWSASTRITLQPLNKEKSRQLVNEILHRMPNPPQALTELIISRADGNPLYIAEMVRVLIEDGVILCDEDKWKLVPERLLQVHLPTSLTGIVQARLDALPGSERQVLQKAAIIGRTFWDSALFTLLNDQPSESIADLLSRLRERGLLTLANTSSLPNSHEYHFQSTILHEVTYESVLKRQRRADHQQIAEWLVQNSGEHANALSVTIAEHFERAENFAEAAKWYQRAAKRTAQQYASNETLRLLERALSLTPAEDLQTRYELLYDQAIQHEQQAQRKSQQACLEALQAAAAALQAQHPPTRGQPVPLAEAALFQARFENDIGNYTNAIRNAQTAISLARQAANGVEQAQAFLVWGEALTRQGDYNNAHFQLQQALRLSRHHGLPNVEATTLRILGNILLDQGLYSEAIVAYQHSLSVSQQIGDRWNECWVLNDLGLALYYQGEIVQSQTMLQQAIQDSHAIGNQKCEAYALGNLGDLSSRQGEYTLSRGLHQRSLLICQTISDRLGEAMALCNLGALYDHYGASEEAYHYLQRAHSLHVQIGNRSGEGETLAALSLWAYRRSDLVNALDYNQRALDISQPGNDRNLLATIFTWRGHIYLAQDDLANAQSAYEHALMLRRELSHLARTAEPLAGLVRIAQRSAEPIDALDLVEEILALPNQIVLINNEDPFNIYLACIETLLPHSSARAHALLAQVGLWLNQRSARIADDRLRRLYLSMPAHRRLLELLASSTPSQPH